MLCDCICLTLYLIAVSTRFFVPSIVDMSANTKVRIEGTKNLVDTAIKYNVRQIQSQSIAFAYEAGDDLATEATPLDYQSTLSDIVFNCSIYKIFCSFYSDFCISGHINLL